MEWDTIATYFGEDNHTRVVSRGAEIESHVHLAVVTILFVSTGVARFLLYRINKQKNKQAMCLSQ